MVTLTPDGAILVDGERVGVLRYAQNHIERIEVLPSERGQGYATNALECYLDRMAARGYMKVTTTPATSPAIRHILREHGFEVVDDPAKHDFLDKGPDEMYLSCFVKQL